MVCNAFVLAVALAGQVHNPLDPAELRRSVEFLASDQLQGRDTPSPGLDRAAKFIADSVKAAGAKPAGEAGAFYQTLPMRQLAIVPQGTTVQLGGQTFRHGDDFIALIPAKPGKTTVSGGIVFVGHGWVLQSKGVDPYKGLDLKGKFVFVCPTSPKDLTAADTSGPAGSWSDPISAIQARGAAGIIFSPAFHNLAGWQLTRKNDVERGRTILAGEDTSHEINIPSIIVSPRLLAAIFEGEASRAADVFNTIATKEPPPSHALSASKVVTVSLSVKETRASARNVIAMIPGSDPVLKNEIVAVGAHYDHLGTGREVAGDSIYNGADDNASGSAALIAVAQALSQGPRPKRSVLIVWHCGEEKGNMGSQYFVDHPTVDLKRIVAYVNVDMVGRSRKLGDKDPVNGDLSTPDTLYAIGPKAFSRDLDSLVAEAASKTGVKLDPRFDTLSDPRQLMFRSDQASYGNKGIPFVFYYGGEHRDYHQPSDSADKIDYSKVALAARLILETVRTVGNATQRPRMDRAYPDGIMGN